MADRHYFTQEDAPALVRDIIDYCKKWGLWRDNCICAGGKRYYDYSPEMESDSSGDLLEGYEDVCVEDFPESMREQLFTVPIESYTGGYELNCLCNPERLLDMAFEGPLYDLLYLHRYRAAFADLSPEAKAEIGKLLLEGDSEICYGLYGNRCELELEALYDVEDFMERHDGWDPMEFDSYEEYLDLVGYEDPFYGEDNPPVPRQEIVSREEMTEALEKSEASIEGTLYKVFLKKKFEDNRHDLTITDYGELMEKIDRGFTDIFDKYGLRYILCTSATLTAYRRGEKPITEN